MSNLILTDDEIKIIEDNGFNIETLEQDSSVEIDLHQYTPAEEDWYLPVQITKDSSFMEELKELAEDTCWADDELVMWVDAKYNGTCKGIPEIKKLVDDTAWKKAIVQKLYNDLKNGCVSENDFIELSDGTILSMEQVKEACDILSEKQCENASQTAKAFVQKLEESVEEEEDEICRVYKKIKVCFLDEEEISNEERASVIFFLKNMVERILCEADDWQETLERILKIIKSSPKSEKMLNALNVSQLVDKMAFNREMLNIHECLRKEFFNSKPPIDPVDRHLVRICLIYDIEDVVLAADDKEKTWDRVMEIINNSPMAEKIKEKIHPDHMLENIRVRSDFVEALKGVKNGCKLSGILDYSFTKNDLKELAKLHKSNKCRRKIEELLEDCNFHYECGKFAAKEYEEFLN